jgi:ribonucleotide monophosphatase NagD (HAD superfamily)
VDECEPLGTGVAPEMYAGKPSAFLLQLLADNHVDMTRTLVVGDRLDTDIAFGKAGGAGMTVMALTGVCTMARPGAPARTA